MPHVTAAPHPVTLGGSVYQMHPLADVDYEEINNWLRGQFIEQIRKSMVPTLTGAERSEIMQAVVLAARKLSFINATDVDFALEKLQVMAKMIQQGLRPVIEVSHVADVFKNKPDEAAAALAIWYELNVPQKEEDTTQPGSPKAAESRPTRKKSTAT